MNSNTEVVSYDYTTDNENEEFSSWIKKIQSYNQDEKDKCFELEPCPSCGTDGSLCYWCR